MSILLEFQGGPVVNADARLTASSLVVGLTAVSKPSNSQLIAGSGLNGQTAVAKPSDSRFTQGSTLKGFGGINIPSESRFTAGSAFVGSGVIVKPADARLLTYSTLLGLTNVAKSGQSSWSLRTGETGLTAVSKPSNSSIIASSRQLGTSSVARPAESRLSSRSTLAGLTGVAKVAQSALAFTSNLLGSATVTLGGIAADARLAFRSLLQWLADVIPSVVAPGVIITDDREIEMTWEDNRTISTSWENDLEMEMYFGDNRIISLPNFMTRTGLRFEPVIVGDDFRVKRLYKNVPTGSVISIAWFTVKASESDPDVSALIRKTITTTPTSQGQITQADTSVGDIAMYFDPTRVETALASISIEYVYDIQVKTTDDRIYTLEKGTIPFILGVTSATS